MDLNDLDFLNPRIIHGFFFPRIILGFFFPRINSILGLSSGLGTFSEFASSALVSRVLRGNQ